MKTTVNVHLVPTDEDSSILLTQNKLYWTGDNTEPPKNSAKNQHLYFTLLQSNLEISKIKEGDWYIVELYDITGKSTGKHIEQCKSINDVWINSESIETSRHIGNCKKIVASTDYKLYTRTKIDNSDHLLNICLPAIPQSFIQHYIAKYNNGDIIKNVEIELEYEKHGNPTAKWNKLKLTSNNEVIVAPTFKKRLNEIIR